MVRRTGISLLADGLESNPNANAVQVRFWQELLASSTASASIDMPCSKSRCIMPTKVNTNKV